MNCAEIEILVHALIDGELDAGHARKVEVHTTTCSACREKLASLRALRQAISGAGLKEAAPLHLRRRVEAALAVPASRIVSVRSFLKPTRRSFFGGFALGSALSAVAATSVVLTFIRGDQEQAVVGEVIAAHVRSLQAGHLMDVATNDQHTVKPWFNGRVDIAPPVIDLTADGFTLLGGRLDYIDGEPVAAIIYQRRKHVINLFVAGAASIPPAQSVSETIQGYNVRHWSQGGLSFWAVSDLAGVELDAFVQGITRAAARAAPAS